MRATNNIYVLSGSHYSAAGDKSVLGEVYGIQTHEGIVLIDCGAETSGPATLRETLAYYEISNPITCLFITHAHWDHCGGAKELQDSGVQAIIGKGDEEYCLKGGPKGLNSPFENGHCFPAFTPDIIIDGDQSIEIGGVIFELIQIPGHSPGSIAIRVAIDGKVALFTGDALQPDGKFLDSVSLGWQGDPAFNREDVVASMQKLTKYEADMILPGHGKICLRNGGELLKLAAQTAFLTMR